MGKAQDKFNKFLADRQVAIDKAAEKASQDKKDAVEAFEKASIAADTEYANTMAKLDSQLLELQAEADAELQATLDKLAKENAEPTAKKSKAVKK